MYSTRRFALQSEREALNDQLTLPEGDPRDFVLGWGQYAQIVPEDMNTHHQRVIKLGEEQREPCAKDLWY